MTIAARAACALAALALLAAAPPGRAAWGPVPAGAQSEVVKRYVDALRAGDYERAYGLLTDEERRYFRDAAAFRSVFAADGYALKSATIVAARGGPAGRVFLVREKLAFVDHRTDRVHQLETDVPVGVLPEHGALHVKDPGKPYRAFASASSADASGLRVTVKKVEFWPDRIAVVLTFANLSDGYVTVLPYGKSVLRDDKGTVYRVLSTKNWALTDRQLFVGIPLAPQAQYTGQLTFTAAGRVDDLARTFSLDVAPALRDGADAPFDVTVGIAPRA